MKFNTIVIFIISAILIFSIMMVSRTFDISLIEQVKAQSAPHISITEAYANDGTEYFAQHPSIHHPNVRIIPNGLVFKVQPLQFREDLTPSAKILRVHCAIDNNYAYYDKCSTPFEGKSYSWILNSGIPINKLNDGSHLFSVYIDTDKGTTNKAIFPFRVTHSVIID